MPSWSASLKQWLSTLVGRAERPVPAPGSPSVTATAQAVAAVEYSMCDALCDGRQRTWPAWDAREDAPTSPNAFGARVSLQHVNDSAAAISIASGIALTGRRAGAFVDGDAIGGAHERLYRAAGRRVPLVVHTVLRAAARQARTSATGHDGYHAVADSGAFLALATRPQEAVDLTIAARKIAELSLTPGVVGMDAVETALGVSEVLMPGAALIRELVGAADGEIDAATAGQRLIFGDRRERAPGFIDPDRPMGLGLPQAGADVAAASLAQKVFFSEHLATIVPQVLDEVGRKTGRLLSLVRRYRMDDARLVIVAQGSLVELAERVADRVREKQGFKVGVVGVVFLRPFPLRELRDALANAEMVTVLDRSDDPLSEMLPLMREVRAAATTSRARFISVQVAGGQPVNAADLVAVCENMGAGPSARALLSLGVGAPARNSTFPKREALTQAIARDYPQLTQRALAASAATDVRPKDARTILVVTREPVAFDNLGAVLATAAGPQVRGRWNEAQPGCWIARFNVASDPLAESGDDALADAVVLTDGVAIPELAIRDDAVVVLQSETARDQAYSRLPARLRRTLAAKRARLVVVGDANTLDKAAWKGLLGLGDRQLEETLSSTLPVPALDVDTPVPALVRRLSDGKGAYDSLPRFHGEVVQPRVTNNDAAATAEPHVALAAAPCGSAVFRDAAREVVPVIDPAACSGCGKCWTACPDGAIGVTALRTEALLNGAAELVTARSPVADKLKRAHKQLAGRVDALLVEKKARVADEALLSEAFGWLVDKMGIAESERPAFSAAFKAELAIVGKSAFSVTDAFFTSAHKNAKGTGDLITLAVNPQSCQGCGVCATSCTESAIRMDPVDAAATDRMTAAWRAWEDLPDTSGETIARMSANPDVGPLAAILTSRHCLGAVTGGDRAEPASGERLALRLAAAVVEHRVQYGMAERAAKLQELANSVREKLTKTLTAGLPTSEMANLAAALAGEGTRKEPLAEILARVDRNPTSAAVDAAAARRLSSLAVELDAMLTRLTKGEHGLGRSRFCVVADEGIGSWLAGFPFNPVFAPLLVDGGAGMPELVAGIAEGLLAQAVDEYRIVRRAELAVEGATDLPLREEKLAAIGWRDVPVEFLAAHPPVLLVARWDDVAARGSTGLQRLLASGLPVKVLLLDGIDPAQAAIDPTMMALAQRTATVASSSIAHPAHLYDSWRLAVANAGPALVRIHAPSPSRHGFAADALISIARNAVENRTHFLLTYDANAAGVFGTRLSLAGNPDVAAMWPSDVNAPVKTPLHWAMGESRFAGQFTMQHLNGDAAKYVTVDRWVGLDASGRHEKAPMMGTVDENATIPSEAMRRFLELRESQWRMLQELAGVVTPFTERIHAEAKAALESAHASELAALKEKHASELAAAVGSQRQAIAAEIKARLLQMASAKQPSTPTG